MLERMIVHMRSKLSGFMRLGWPGDPGIFLRNANWSMVMLTLVAIWKISIFNG